VHANELPTEADNTVRTAIANASANLILFDIDILHPSKAEVASALQMATERKRAS